MQIPCEKNENDRQRTFGDREFPPPTGTTRHARPARHMTYKIRKQAPVCITPAGILLCPNYY